MSQREKYSENGRSTTKKATDDERHSRLETYETCNADRNGTEAMNEQEWERTRTYIINDGRRQMGWMDDGRVAGERIGKVRKGNMQR